MRGLRVEALPAKRNKAAASLWPADETVGMRR
jgi:hypothetical protein